LRSIRSRPHHRRAYPPPGSNSTPGSHVAATWDGSVSGSNIHLYQRRARPTALRSMVPEWPSRMRTRLRHRPTAAWMWLGRFDGGIDEVRLQRCADGRRNSRRWPMARVLHHHPHPTLRRRQFDGPQNDGRSTSSVTLGWTASTDLPASGGTGVAGTTVYRNGNTSTPVGRSKAAPRSQTRADERYDLHFTGRRV